MRNVINTTANVTTTAIVNRDVRTVMAGVDGARALPRFLRLYAAPARAGHAHAHREQWLHAGGKQKPSGCLASGSELSRCSRRAMSRRRCPRGSSCLGS